MHLVSLDYVQKICLYYTLSYNNMIITKQMKLKCKMKQYKFNLNYNYFYYKCNIFLFLVTINIWRIMGINNLFFLVFHLECY